MGALHELLDHHYLNEVPGPRIQTSENLAHFIAERVKLPLVSVTVHETCASRCTVYVAQPR